MEIVHVVGARPNFMKIAPLMAAVERSGIGRQYLVHTGQHYDPSMSDVFFEELGMRRPDAFLGVGGGSQTEQTAKAMIGFEQVCLERRPDVVVVVGDVNSTIAAALVASKLHIPVAHVEAGLRSGDMKMPEEVNRVLTDRISDLLLTPSPDADENLLKEGLPKERIFRVGNIMIDTLLSNLPRAKQTGAVAKLGLKPKGYGVVTLHRASNVDDRSTLTRLVDGIDRMQKKLPVVFPVHPRTRKQLEAFGLLARLEKMGKVQLIPPQGYLEFMDLTAHATVVATDSGGLQEETTALGIPCLTLREDTERPVTVTEGTNTIVGTDPQRLEQEVDKALSGKGKKGSVPALWDGKTSERIVEILERMYGGKRAAVAEASL